MSGRPGVAGTEADVPCPSCGATSYNYCVDREADKVEASLDAASFTEAAKVIRRLGSEDLRRLVMTLQYRAFVRAVDRGGA